MTFHEIIRVGIGEYKTGSSPSILRTVLGSCVGVLIYDNAHKIGGLAHVYLPDSREYNSAGTEATGAGYADVIIPLLLKKMDSLGCDRHLLMAYITGGANLFGKKGCGSQEIGGKNLGSVKAILDREGIPSKELEVGGSSARMVKFLLEDGSIEISDLSDLIEEARR